MSLATPQVYVEQLERLKFGRPLYNPEHPVDIGDVGFFQQDTGNFRPLFNIFFEARDQPYARFGSPEGYEPLSQDYLCFTSTKDYFPPQPIKSSSVETKSVGLEASADVIMMPAGAGITFSCANKLGATLLLRAATTRADLDNNRFVHEYILKHIDSWYEYAWRLGYGEVQAPEGSIVLIKGCDKTTSWAHATFAERTREASVFFDGGYFNVGGVVRLQGSLSRGVSAIYREAPLGGQEVTANMLPLPQPARIANPLHATARNESSLAGLFPEECTYTIFTRVYRIRRRSVLGMVKMVTVDVDGRSSHHRLPRSQPTSGSRLTSSRALTSSRTQDLNVTTGMTRGAGLEDVYEAADIESTDVEDKPTSDEEASISVDPDLQLGGHVLDQVLNYISKKMPDANIVMTTDEDLFTLFPDSALPEDVGAVLEKLQPDCSLHNGLGTLHSGRHATPVQVEDYTPLQMEGTSTTTIFNPLSRVDAKDVQGALDQNDDILDEGNEFYVKQDKIGEGSFANVYKGYDKRTQETVAIKTFDLESAEDEVEVIQQEMQGLSRLDSPFLTKYYGSYLKGSLLSIVTEFCSGGSCAELMKAGVFQEEYISIVVRELLHGLEYLHSEGRPHLDVKAANILLSADGDVKLADFGVTEQLSRTLSARKSLFNGNTYWMSPEVTKQSGHDHKADIWSLGITAIELAKGEPPYAELHPMKVVFLVTKSPPPTLEGTFSSDFQEFVSLCLQKNPSDRPTVKELLKHKFIRLAKNTSHLAELMERHQRWKMQGALKEEQDATHRENNFQGEGVNDPSDKLGNFDAVQHAEIISKIPAGQAANLGADEATNNGKGVLQSRNNPDSDPTYGPDPVVPPTIVPSLPQVVPGDTQKARRMLNNYLQSHGGWARLSWDCHCEDTQNAVIWTATTYISGILYGNATGQTKGIAQEKAAQQTLRMLEDAERRTNTSLAHQSSS